MKKEFLKSSNEQLKKFAEIVNGDKPLRKVTADERLKVGVDLGTSSIARDWSPRLAYTILPIPNKGVSEWWYAWVPMCGPIVGGLLACALQTALV